MVSCRVQQLSLRYNGITDIGAVGIGLALGNVMRQNQKLLFLNLTGNKIGDVGAHHIADVRFTDLISLCSAFYVS